MAPPQIGDEQPTKFIEDSTRLSSSDMYSNTDPFPDCLLMFVKFVSVKVMEGGVREIRGVVSVVYSAVDVICMDVSTIAAESSREKSE